MSLLLTTTKKIKKADEDTFSVISKRNRYSNALIEKATQELKEAKEKDQMSQT